MADWPSCGGGSGSTTGGAIQVVITGTGGATAFDSAAQIPDGALVSVCDADISDAFDGSATILVGTPTNPVQFADSTASDLDPATPDLYHVPQRTPVSPASIVRVTVGGTPTAGEGVIMVYWWIPEV